MTIAQFKDVEFKRPQDAFEQAIAAGRLSDLVGSPIYAGNYMYMGTSHGKDHFKHRETRAYIA